MSAREKSRHFPVHQTWFYLEKMCRFRDLTLNMSSNVVTPYISQITDQERISVQLFTEFQTSFLISINCLFHERYHCIPVSRRKAE